MEVEYLKVEEEELVAGDLFVLDECPMMMLDPETGECFDFFRSSIDTPIHKMRWENFPLFRALGDFVLPDKLSEGFVRFFVQRRVASGISVLINYEHLRELEMNNALLSSKGQRAYLVHNGKEYLLLDRGRKIIWNLTQDVMVGDMEAKKLLQLTAGAPCAEVERWRGAFLP